MNREWISLMVLAMCVIVTTGIYASETGGANPDMSLCITCHGSEGEGSRSLNAPGLGNLQDWYIERQLRNFRDGLRGTDPADQEGAQMSATVQTLSDESIHGYARIISSYPDYVPEATAAESASDRTPANASKGKAYYAHQCGACHGPAGKGIKSLGAPGLAGMEDWYLRGQLDKFQSGIRGSAKGDIHGAQMVFYMNRLKNKEDLGDIIAYLRDPASVD
jgi:cytochrome c oxidase subunit 2